MKYYFKKGNKKPNTTLFRIKTSKFERFEGMRMGRGWEKGTRSRIGKTTADMGSSKEIATIWGILHQRNMQHAICNTQLAILQCIN